ncbi:hypothetical protein HYH03_003798 [Edaphochlamys debaryana]|uniref:Uncharacterized protein n=1 Tax=Edaphochlamys debaryana TaxID=47281 RepID=A0A835YAR1_9CHLO|nr:hypothetical protein HYH03_003798 [Edaphochlamys debaryana]|eukprot:KAG2498037.1 hypothetical protein HYH03_003798 [Edaphochlamys debaryana]
MASSRGSTALETVLRQLGVEGADKIVDALLPPPSAPGRRTNLSNARLACRALTSFLDSGVRKLYFNVRLDGTPRQVPRLERWERVKSLELVLHPVADEEEDDGNADVREELHSLMLLPLRVQSPEALQRITTLAVRWEPAFIGMGVAEPSLQQSVPPLAISMLAQYLPSLKELNLDLPINTVLFYNWQHMYESLAALPHLDSLRLTSCEALHGIAALAPRLKRLRLSPTYICSSMAVPPAAVAQLGQLTALTHLGVAHGRFETGTLRDLLSTLPAGKPEFRLALAHIPTSPGGSWTSEFRAGRMRELSFQGKIGDLAAAAAGIILPSLGLGDRLGLLHLVSISLQGEPLGQAALAPLQGLLGRCDRVQLGALGLARSPAAAPVAQALALFGPPQSVVWDVHFGYYSKVQFPAAPPAPAAAAAPAAVPAPSAPAEHAAAGPVAAAAAAAPPVPLPAPADVLQRAVDRLAAAHVGQPIAAAAPHFARVLLARGAGVRLLAQAPSGILDWLNELARGHAPAGSPPDYKAVGAVRVLPSASAVLLTHSEAPGALEALAAAAAAAASGQPGFFQLVGLGTEVTRADPARALSPEISKAVEEALLAGAGHGAAALLEWVVGFTAFLKSLPEPQGLDTDF